MIYNKETEDKIKDNLINFKENQQNLANEFLDLILTRENIQYLENLLIEESKKGKFTINVSLPFSKDFKIKDLEKFKDLLFQFLSCECHYRFSSENIGWLGDLELTYSQNKCSLKEILNRKINSDNDNLLEKVFKNTPYGKNQLKIEFDITKCALNFKLFILHKNAKCGIENDGNYI